MHPSPAIAAARHVDNIESIESQNNRLEAIAMNAVLAAMEMVGQKKAGGVDITAYRIIEKALKRVAERDEAKVLDSNMSDPGPENGRADTDEKLTAAEKSLSEE